MLVAPGGTRPAWAFAAGWVGSLAAVAAVVLLVADVADAEEPGGPATWVSILRIALGILLALFAAWQWRARGGHGTAASAPGWMRRLDGIGPAGSAGLAVSSSTSRSRRTCC